MKLNPALTGVGYSQKAHLYYRQKGKIGQPFLYLMQASFAHHFEAKRMSVGVSVESHQTQHKLLSEQQVALSYAYRVPINKHSYLQMALQARFCQRSLHWQHLVFADQYNELGELVYPTAELAPAKQLRVYPDFSSGWVLLWQKRWVLGMSLAHLAQPNIGFYAENEQVLAWHLRAHMSVVLPLTQAGKRGWQLSLMPHFIYQQREKDKQFQIGIYLNANPIVIASWYRQRLTHSKTLSLMLGVNYKSITFAYAYDMAIATPKYAPMQVHALNIVYAIPSVRHKRYQRSRTGYVALPTF